MAEKTIFGIPIGGLASLALPFLPGPWGAVAGGALSMLNGNEAQGNVDRIAGQQQGVADTLFSNYLNNAPQLTEGLLSGSGISNDRRTEAQKQDEQLYQYLLRNMNDNSISGVGFKRKDAEYAKARKLMEERGITDADVKAYVDATSARFDPNYNPYESVISDVYSPGAIAQRASRYFDPRGLEGTLAAGEDALRSPYDASVRSVEADAARRGTTNSSFTSSAVSNIRANQARDNSNFRTGQLRDLQNQSNAYSIGQEGVGQQLLTSGIDEARRRLEGTNQTLMGGVDRGIGITGGLRGMYASEAADANAAGGDMLQTIARSGVLTPRKKTVGTPPINPAPYRETLGVGGGYTPGFTGLTIPPKYKDLKF